MRGLGKKYIGKGHHTDTQTHRQTSLLLDQLDPEGQVGENIQTGIKNVTMGQYWSNWVRMAYNLSSFEYFVKIGLKWSKLKNGSKIIKYSLKCIYLNNLQTVI